MGFGEGFYFPPDRCPVVGDQRGHGGIYLAGTALVVLGDPGAPGVLSEDCITEVPDQGRIQGLYFTASARAESVKYTPEVYFTVSARAEVVKSKRSVRHRPEQYRHSRR